jgi:rubrerythrin
VFTNPDLQALFNSLVGRGNQSLSEALKVGAAIEEIDILDLEKYLSQTDNADIQKVFTDLNNGSYNHLSAFTSTLNRQTGETYQPQYLSVEAYQAILETRTGEIGNAGSGGGLRNGRP